MKVCISALPWLMSKFMTTCHYTATGIRLGANPRSKLLLSSMLPRLKLYSRLGKSTSRVYVAEITLGELRRSLHLREQDIFILHEVLGHSPYLRGDLFENPPHCIIDLGAHIGLATLQFKAAFPDAVIHCYEPDPENFRLLELNTQALPTVVLHHEGVGPELANAILYVHSNRHSATSLEPPRDKTDVHEVECLVKPLDTILREAGDPVDLIKFDIEGIEYPVFSHSSLVHQVRFLVGEIKAPSAELDRFRNLFPRHHVSIQHFSKNMHFIHLRKNLAL
jgi:FkbM family methyltransferase